MQKNKLNTRTVVIGAFVITALAQWVIPGNMIREKEAVLRNGKVFRFRTEPVDPSHPFKGRYIVLSFRENQFATTTPDSALFPYGDAYVLLEKDPEGFAKIKDIVKQKPAMGVDYVQAAVSYIESGKDTAVIHLQYPFDAFYMDEFKAPRAEALYQESAVDSIQKAYAVVSILHGDAVVKDVMINDQSVRKLVQQKDPTE